MMPIHELLNRIRWDEHYAAARFVIGYYDRFEERVIHVPFRKLYFNPDNHFGFELLDDEGELHAIPFHRVREVYRNGELIWQREPPAEPGEPTGET